MMHIWGVLGDPKNASKIPPCRGDSLLERVRVLERSRDGVREGPGEKRRSDDARAPGVGAGGATACRAKALGWTGSALDHGGVAGFKGCRRCRRPRTGAASVADILARTPMKCAAKCDNRRELQNSANQWPLERALRSWDIPESMSASVLLTLYVCWFD